MQLFPYLGFHGDCAAAFDFYAAALQGEIVEKHVYAGSPMAEQAPPGWEDKVMHVSLRFGEQMLMGCDNPEPHQGFHGITLTLQTTSIPDAERTFAALAQGGTVIMPLAQTFWAARFGVTRDRFGVTWNINCDVSE